MHDELADVYDDATRRLLDRSTTEPRPIPAQVATGWRAGLGATAMLTAAAIGVRDVLEPKQDAPVIDEIDLDALGACETAPVVYRHVPGRPSASTAVVRPWLIG